jgi:hypothetical protein
MPKKSGASRQRMKKRRRNRDKVWDLLATKSLLLPTDIPVVERLEKLNLPNTRTNRIRMLNALMRSGIWNAAAQIYYGADVSLRNGVGE